MTNRDQIEKNDVVAGNSNILFILYRNTKLLWHSAQLQIDANLLRLADT